MAAGHVERLFTNRLEPASTRFLDRLRDARVSAHFFIDRDGRCIAVRVLPRARLARRCVDVPRSGCAAMTSRSASNSKVQDFEPYAEAQYVTLNDSARGAGRALPARGDRGAQRHRDRSQDRPRSLLPLGAARRSPRGCSHAIPTCRAADLQRFRARVLDGALPHRQRLKSAKNFSYDAHTLKLVPREQVEPQHIVVSVGSRRASADEQAQAWPSGGKRVLMRNGVTPGAEAERKKDNSRGGYSLWCRRAEARAKRVRRGVPSSNRRSYAVSAVRLPGARPGRLHIYPPSSLAVASPASRRRRSGTTRSSAAMAPWSPSSRRRSPWR